MIKIFRRIRYDLIGENKTGKYLKYAIGEIVLVVIGILIALQLNNLNDERKIEEIKQVYYKQLLIDFDKDEKYIENLSIAYESNLVTLRKYKEIFKQQNLPMLQI